MNRLPMRELIISKDISDDREYTVYAEIIDGIVYIQKIDYLTPGDRIA